MIAQGVRFTSTTVSDVNEGFCYPNLKRCLHRRFWSAESFQMRRFILIPCVSPILNQTRRYLNTIFKKLKWWNSDWKNCLLSAQKSQNSNNAGLFWKVCDHLVLNVTSIPLSDWWIFRCSKRHNQHVSNVKGFATNSTDWLLSCVISHLSCSCAWTMCELPTSN